VNVLFAAATLAATLILAAATAPTLSQCDSLPVQGRPVAVNDVGGLEKAVARAKPGDAIELTDGEYRLRRTLEITAPNVSLRSRSDDPRRVVLRGEGMTTGNIGVAVAIGAPGVTVAGVTIRDVRYHAVQVRGERAASHFTLYNARLLDTGQQLLKGSFSDNGLFAESGLVACSEFAYTTHAPSDYTDGVDILGTKRWIVRDNRFSNIRGPESGRWRAGPAILVWGGAEDTVVERNLVIDSFRGIALGLRRDSVDPSGTHQPYDHLHGVVRNNVIVNLNPWADEGIELNGAPGAAVEYNTVYVEGALPWSISVRFPATTASIVRNVTNRRVTMRDGGRATLDANVTGAMRSWFVDPAHGDLHMTAHASALNAGAFNGPSAVGSRHKH
jgi:hypothetical protein